MISNFEETKSPITDMDYHFRTYLERRKNDKGAHMDGNGLPDYAYSKDYEYRKKLDSIPNLYNTAKKICGTYASRMRAQVNQFGLAVGPTQYSEVYQMGCDCAKMLGIGIPNIYILGSSEINAYTIAGDDVEPIIVIYSGLLERFTPGELKAVIGHECGHIHNQHGVYNRLASLLLGAGAGVGGMISQQLIGLITQGSLLAIKMWSRAAEITADRAALICSDSVEDAHSVNKKFLYGGAMNVVNDLDATLDINALKEQLDMQLGNITRFDTLEDDHPAEVRRIFADIEFTQCQTFYEWRPELKKPGQILRSKEECDKRCARIVDILKV